MSLEEAIRAILFNIGKEIKLLKIDNDNIIISLDYDKYVEQILLCYNLYGKEQHERDQTSD